MIDIPQVRKDTPACENLLFFNSAGSSLMPQPVLKVMADFQELEAEIGGYAAAGQKATEIGMFYDVCAELLHTNRQNIGFVYNATDGFSKAVSSIPLSKGDFILTTDDDYISNHILFLSLQKRFGIQIIRCACLPSGDLDLNDMEEKIVKYKPVLVTVTHIPTNTGKIQPVEQVGSLCVKHGVWYIVDGCQSAGQIPINVEKIKCDFYSATGRKFLRGPRGTGILYVSDKVLESGFEPLHIDMEGATWSDENQYLRVAGAKRFELWEANYVNWLGLKEAVRYACQVGLENIAAYNQNLMDHLRDGLGQIKSIVVTENGSRSGSIVTFTSYEKPLEQIKQILNAGKVSYTVGFRQFALIDFNKKNVDWVIRLSPHYFNTTNEIDKVLDILS
jgi:cysteine desulfurase/selenocysteine lyase